MNDDNLNKTPEQSEQREGDARFDVTSLDEVKDENGNGIFHMDSRAVNPVADCGRCADLFGLYGRAQSRSVATGDLVRLRGFGVLFRREKVVGYGGSELHFIFRCVADTGLAIGS